MLLLQMLWWCGVVCVDNGVYAVYNVYMDLVLGAGSSVPSAVDTRGHPDTRP